MVRIKLL